MLRVRFKVNLHKDYRPVLWPIKHPYWCIGYSSSHSILVAYADDKAEIYRNWPEAKEIDIEEVDDYFFSSRFPKPEWFKNES